MEAVLRFDLSIESVEYTKCKNGIKLAKIITQLNSWLIEKQNINTYQKEEMSLTYETVQNYLNGLLEASDLSITNKIFNE